MNEELRRQLDRARESLSAAELLRSQGYNDFAASRAYYAMFYVAEALLSSIGHSFSSHGAVQAAYGREYARTDKLDPKFHRWLIDASDARNVADYGVDAVIGPDQAHAICRHAAEFIDAAANHLSSEPDGD